MDSRGQGLPRQALTVREALLAMQAAVRLGEMVEAQQLGRQCVLPLSLSKAELQMGSKLFEGAESSVFRGTWHGRDVAVKRVRMSTSADLDRFRSELLILSRLDHSAVVPLLGARALPPDYLLVLPLAHSNLRELLHSRGWRPCWRRVLAIGQQLAAGMAAVHAAGVIHRDLKPGNVLALDPEATRIQVTDFGIALDLSAHRQQHQQQHEASDASAATMKGQSSSGSSSVQHPAAAHNAHSVRNHGRPTGGFHKRQMVGTLEYMAPELLMRSAGSSTASDMYAFAVTLNELATGVVPFSDCTKDNPEVHTVLEMGYGRQELAAAVAAEGLRPLLPKVAPPGYTALLEACWAASPLERPTFAQVLTSLEQIARGLDAWERQELQQLDLEQPMKLHQKGQGLRAVSLKAFGSGGLPMEVVATVVAEADGDTEDASDPMQEDGPPQPEAQEDEEAVPPHRMSMVSMRSNGGEADMDADSGSEEDPELCGVDTWLAGEALAGYRPTLNAGAFEAIGPRDTMEDRHVLAPCALMADCSGKICGGGAHVFAVFDGHRGADAADFCATHLLTLLHKVAASASSPAAALRRVFRELDAAYHERWTEQLSHPSRRSNHTYPGCTALVAMVVGGRLLVANAGDGRAVLCRGGRAAALSRDHTAADDAERARLQAAGTAVTRQHGDWRVGAAGLQVTRCIGDFDVKHWPVAGGMSAAAVSTSGLGSGEASAPQQRTSRRRPPQHGAKAGVTSEPEITSIDLCEDDTFLLLASDGLWDCLHNQEAVGLVLDTVKDPGMCAKRLVLEALMRGANDNVTAVVAFLRPVSTLERVFAEGREAHAHTATMYGTRKGAAGSAQHAQGRSADELRDTY